MRTIIQRLRRLLKPSGGTVADVPAVNAAVRLGDSVIECREPGCDWSIEAPEQAAVEAFRKHRFFNHTLIQP